MLLIVGDSLTSGHIGIGFSQYLTAPPSKQITLRGIDGDTMLGVTTRALRYVHNKKMAHTLDALIIECGGNDVLLPSLLRSGHMAWEDTGKALIREDSRPIDNPVVFGKRYRERLIPIVAQCRILALPTTHIALTTISPLGENPNTPLQQLRTQYNDQIRSITKEMHLSLIDFDSAGLLDNDSAPPHYFIDNPNNFTRDALHIQQNPVLADRVSAERGLHTTIDGIHFNSIGARKAAAACSSFINHIGYFPS